MIFRNRNHPEEGNIMSSLKVMTLNILNNSLYGYGNSRFKRRIEAIREMIRETQPDLIGVQELTAEMLPAMESLLETYGWVGDSRRSHINNEYSVILYKKERFEVLRHETFWLSDTPQVLGSRFQLSQFPRITVFALMKDRDTGEQFSFFNTHLDVNLSEVRRLQAMVLRDLILTHHRGEFTLVTGDFNDVRNSAPLNAVYEAGLEDLSDDTLGSTLRGRIGSARYHNRPIDHILISDKVRALDVTKISRSYNGCWPSDHYPLLAVLSY